MYYKSILKEMECLWFLWGMDLLIMGDSYERTEVIDMMMTDGKLKKLQAYLEKQRKERSYEQEER